MIRRQLYRQAKAFLVYGSAGEQYLRGMGMKQPVFLAWNATGSEEIAAAKKKWEEEGGAKQQPRFRAPGTYSLLYIGRLIPEKKVLLLPDILAALDAHSGSKETGLVVIGEGPAMEALREKTARMGLGDRVRFAGGLQGPEQTAGYFLSADMLLLPGKGGLAISEAIQYGLPVVAGKADGTEQDLVVSGENGFLVEEESPEAFATAIESVCAGEESLRKMRTASLAQAAKYGNTAAMQQGFLQAIEYVMQSQDEV
jgi:glycosyltransferase involved in cell wall biosynthesis